MGTASNQVWYFLNTFFNSCDLALISRAEAILLCLLLSNWWYTFAFFFLYRIHFLYLSSCTRKILLTFPERQRLPSKVSAFRDKLYLQMVLEDICFLVPRTQDFHILSSMLKTAFIKFLHIFFAYIFYTPMVFLKLGILVDSRITRDCSNRYIWLLMIFSLKIWNLLFKYS